MSEWRERLDEYGVPSDAVAQAVREELGALVGQTSSLNQAIQSNPVLREHGDDVGRYLAQTEADIALVRRG